MNGVKEIEAWKANRHCISMWLSKDEFEELKQSASASNVKVSVYVRGIVIDAINDERDRQMLSIPKNGRNNCINE